MDVQIDQAGADDHPARINDELGLLEALADRQNLPTAQPEVTDPVDVLAGVDQMSAGDLDGPHVSRSFRRRRGSAWSAVWARSYCSTDRARPSAPPGRWLLVRGWPSGGRRRLPGSARCPG